MVRPASLKWQPLLLGVLSIVLLAPSIGLAQIAKESGEIARVDFTNTGASSSAASFATLPTAGATVICPIGGADYSATDIDWLSGVADNQGNGAYTIIKKAPATGGNSLAALAYKENVASSGTFTVTVTATNSSLVFFSWGCASFTSMPTSSSVDQQATGGAITAETSLSVTTGTTTQADELVVAALAIDANDAALNIAQSTGGFTNLYLQNDGQLVGGFRADYKIVASTATYNTNWTFDSADSSAGVIATFKAAAGGGGGTTRNLMLMGVGQ